MTPTLPTIHLNGTGRQKLLDDYNAAYRKLIEFRDAFRSIEFNARDYYVQSSTAFYEARTERDIMKHRIGALMQYLEDHLLHLAPMTLSTFTATVRAEKRKFECRLAAGWDIETEFPWTAPCGTTESEWEDNGWPLPEEPDFAEWFLAFHHYDTLDAGTTPVPYPNAEPGFRPPSAADA